MLLARKEPKFTLTALVLRVGHERLLHRFWSQDLVLLLYSGGGSRGHDGVGHHLQSLNQGDVAKLLCDGEGCLTVL